MGHQKWTGFIDVIIIDKLQYFDRYATLAKNKHTHTHTIRLMANLSGTSSPFSWTLFTLIASSIVRIISLVSIIFNISLVPSKVALKKKINFYYVLKDSPILDNTNKLLYSFSSLRTWESSNLLKSKYDHQSPLNMTHFTQSKRNAKVFYYFGAFLLLPRAN